eukprot:10137059-Karenia_brevis.AAC.1
MKWALFWNTINTGLAMTTTTTGPLLGDPGLTTEIEATKPLLLIRHQTLSHPPCPSLPPEGE